MEYATAVTARSTKTVIVNWEKGKAMKSKINEWLKVFVLTIVMFAGFFFIYLFAWVWLSLPVVWWTGIVLATLALLSIIGYIWWLQQ